MNYIAIARENRQKALSTLGMNQRNLFIAPCHPIRARRDGLFRSAASRMSPERRGGRGHVISHLKGTTVMSMHARAIDERLARRIDTPASDQRLRGHRLFGSVSDIECMLFSQISSSNAANTAERRPRMHKTDSAEGAKGKNRT